MFSVLFSWQSRKLSIEDDQFRNIFLIFALVVIVGSVLVNIIYNVSVMMKMRKLVPLLKEDTAKEFIAGMEALLKKAKGKGLQSILRVNLAAGYLEADEYDTAIEIMDSIPAQELRDRTVKLVYALNLCSACFFAGKHDRTLAVYHENQTLFASFRDHQMYGGNVAEMEILAAVIEEEHDKAMELLTAAKNKWQDPRLLADFEKIEEILK